MSIDIQNVMARMESNYKLYINGQWVDGTSGKTITSYNPGNGEKLAQFVDASKEDVDRAVEAATKALESWRKTSVVERSNILLKIADVIDENTEFLASVETLDNGKPIRETSKIDVPLAADHFRYFAGVIRSEEGTAKQLDEHTITINLKEPIGVVGQIIPWNFPFLMAAWKLAPALAAGDTVVIKPSSATSLSLLEFTKLLDRILPPGVVNVITGRGSSCGDYMLHHPGFRKLAFTGSTEVGYNVAKAAAENLIPATLELGGKSADIVFDDANLEMAVEGATFGILFNQGQVCCAGSRIFVQETIYDQFIAALKKQFESVKVGFPWKDDVQMGAIVSERQLKKVLSYVDIAKEEGAEILTGGYRLTENGLDQGYYMAPTIIYEANNKMRCAREEIFGPVVTVIKFKDEDEVIRLANDSEYGLGGAVWSNDIHKAMRVATKVETGRMWVNTYNQLPAGAPFGGYKKSGIGRETYKSILDAYTQTKNIFINLNEEPLGFYK